MPKLFTIHVTENVHERLRKYGENGQTFNLIIDNILSEKLGAEVSNKKSGNRVK